MAMGDSVEQWMEGGRRFVGEYFAFKVDGANMVESPISGGLERVEAPSSPESLSPPSSDSESSQGVPVPTFVQSEGRGQSCLSISIYSGVVVALVITFLVVGRDYIKYLLLSLEESSFWLSLLIFLALFTTVSFPMTWGYIILNIAAGYLYGLVFGVLIVMVCALSGIAISYVVIKRCLTNFVMTRLANDSVRAIIRVVDSEYGFKVVALSRLTPIPFGLQNALFAVSNIRLHTYMLASMVGMLPSQSMHAYIGSTLRSMEEVISDSGHSTTAYIVFIAQLLMAVLLLTFVIRRARIEFNKALAEAEVAKRCSSPTSSLCSYDSVDSMEKGGHHRNSSNCSLPPVHTVSPRHKPPIEGRDR